MGAELDLGEAMTPIALNYTSQAGEATVYNGNGTAWMVKDIYSGSDSGNPGVLNGFGNSAIFTAMTEPTVKNYGRAMEQPQAR